MDERFPSRGRLSQRPTLAVESDRWIEPEIFDWMSVKKPFLFSVYL